MREIAMGTRLPLNPDLGFYRKLAKQLKRAVAAGDAAAIARCSAHAPQRNGRAGGGSGTDDLALGDAQHVIAAELGFASWSEFRAAVEAAAAAPQPSPS